MFLPAAYRVNPAACSGIVLTVFGNATNVRQYAAACPKTEILYLE